ncbi:hypothetical protein BCF44_109163 [Kutzneria buriramensis]|uniref:Uncharacterized protein n=1 Tax=Kutzneria buriramensis TaxID=1045776 RepID=A0A3E0HEI1_9PSEU|nr:hypothetical protein BCF44_109163 [Kutzneria buriramensis]
MSRPLGPVALISLSDNHGSTHPVLLHHLGV